MPTSINCPSDARGKWSLPVLLALIALAVVSFLVPNPFEAVRSKPNKEKLVSEMNAILREGKFYDLAVSPKLGTPDAYRVHGVSHTELSTGEQLVED